MRINKKLVWLLLAGYMFALQGCSDNYERFTIDSNGIGSAGAFFIVDSGNIDDMTFIPNQMMDVQFDVVSFGSSLGAQTDVSGLKLSAQVSFTPSTSRAEIKTISLTDVDGNNFPVKAFAVDPEGKTGIFVDCKEGCATYEVDPNAETIEFISVGPFTMKGLTALKKVAS